MPRIGEVIREYRLKAGLTQAKLGEKVGIAAAHQRRIAEWERGARTPMGNHLLKLMAALKIPPEAFDEYKAVNNDQ